MWLRRNIQRSVELLQSLGRQARTPTTYGGSTRIAQRFQHQQTVIDSTRTGSLTERFERGDIVTIASGYIYTFERRGYCQAGAYIPEVILDHPEIVRQQHLEFAHAGSDVMIAVTYFTHREKLELIGRAHELDALNTTALKIAREVADETGTLMAGDLGNTTVYNAQNPDNNQHVIDTFTEQVQWAVEYGADFMIGETFYDYGEALLALRAVQEHGKGIPAVICMTPLKNLTTYDGYELPDALYRLQQEGALAVGLNCSRGPDTMLPALRKCKEKVKGHIGVIPVPYRTTDEAPIFQQLKYPNSDESCFMKHDHDIHMCSRKHVGEFAREAKDIGVSFLGLCCGNTGAHFRAVCEALGRTVPASKFSPDLSKHFAFGDKEKVPQVYNRDELHKNILD